MVTMKVTLAFEKFINLLFSISQQFPLSFCLEFKGQNFNLKGCTSLSYSNAGHHSVKLNDRQARIRERKNEKEKVIHENHYLCFNCDSEGNSCSGLGGGWLKKVLVSNDPFVWIRPLTSVFNLLNKTIFVF